MNSTPRKFRLHHAQSGAAITVRITPRAAQNGISEVLGDGTVKVRLAASNVGEDLDRALLAYLAEVLGVKAGQLDIVAGICGVDKLVTVIGMKAEQVQRKILAHLEKSS